ncbi:phosphate ABC transporter substrate-binding protein PstS [Cyanobium sp. ATX 6A2]|uniref:phosphate ABC transporter substrate-binding protein PstS n=1 Tax=Cyanobium sp. ATX 6A2 TaxID=2823700 RepID=UPI0020CBFB73|nr:phosphate ABC transporter substrate-binding protein PstS [Cyanobium sp. ATX 6A2]MCP9888481.1 phosphate ABC transporter substrate-binding protein PstS [Cyanobium sp. ATX 6A2]
MTFARKATTAAGTITAVALVAAAATPLLAQATISGAGATFPAPFYQRAFAGVASKVRVNYQSVGSGAGVRQFVGGSVDFGATDEPIKAAEAAKVKRGVVQFPAVGGTIAIAFNKSDCAKLNLTQKQAVDIFLGKITTWEQLKCGKGKITVAHRSDGSGTTFAFTNSLSAFSPEWKSRVGEGKAVKWPVGVGGKGNEGVAGVIQNTPGSIGYLNQAYVKGKIKAAALQNKAGKFVMPTKESGAAALNNIKLNANLAGEDPNPAGANSYPISTLTWILAYRSGNGAKTNSMRTAMNHLLSPAAQNQAASLGYVPLQGNILNQAKKAVERIGS